jgi:hypothetical protein
MAAAIADGVATRHEVFDPAPLFWTPAYRRRPDMNMDATND